MINVPDRIFVASGSTLYSKGDPADCAYLILSGRVVLRNLATVAPVCAMERGAGDMIGDLALADDSRRRMEATTLSDCEMLVITRQNLSDRIESVDPVLRLVLSAVMSRYSQLLDHVSPAVREGAAIGPSEVSPLWRAHSSAARDMLSFAHELRSGLQRDELELFYQPIVQLDTGMLSGFETLIRWQHPRQGLLLPDTFIPLAETSGVITEVTTFCLQQVARHLPALKAMAATNMSGTDRLFLTVNVSGHDLARSAFASQAASILCDAGVDPEDVKLEVTESTVMVDKELCMQTLRNCRDQGFTIAIDDFGTGYSSLHYLNAMPIDILKLDRSFARSLLGDVAGLKIIEAIVHLSRDLHLGVVAEGVESAAEVHALRQIGCRYGQGYFFGVPTNLATALRIARDWCPIPPTMLSETVMTAA